MAKYTYKVKKEGVAVGGVKLDEATQRQLRVIYEEGDHRFIDKLEEKVKPKDEGKDKD